MVSDAHVLDMGFGLRRYLRKTNSCLYYSFAYPECTPVSALPSLSLCCHLYCTSQSEKDGRRIHVPRLDLSTPLRPYLSILFDDIYYGERRTRFRHGVRVEEVLTQDQQLFVLFLCISECTP
ncbi:hypothetical protein SFRURICE_005952, partial [Spodoptera frugiperda]